jgi:hypothetical protein
MGPCAYCSNQDVKLTKEHLFPAALHRRLEKSNREYFGQGTGNVFYLGKPHKYMDGEPQVKDVCAECNNGPLSRLDDYICQLWDNQLHRIVERGEAIRFEYNFDLLSRWLLKMCYNSARIHNSDTHHLVKCREYILGHGSHPDHVTMHLQLQYPSPYDSSEIRNAREAGVPATRHEPRMNRVGHFGYPMRNGIGRLGRAVHLQSYLFLIHLFPEKLTRRQREQSLKDFRVTFPYAARLDAKKWFCYPICEGVDSKEAIYKHFLSKGLPDL